MSEAGTRLYWSKQTKKRGVVPRIMLCLIDGQPHKFDEFSEWVGETVENTSAIERYKERVKDPEGVSFDVMIKEGRRISVLQTLRHLETGGHISIVWGEMGAPRTAKSHGYYDIDKAIVQLTEKGMDHILSGNGVYAKMIAEMHHGLLTKRISLTTTYLGLPALKELDEDDNLPVITEED